MINKRDINLYLRLKNKKLEKRDIPLFISLLNSDKYKAATLKRYGVLKKNERWDRNDLIHFLKEYGFKCTLRPGRETYTFYRPSLEKGLYESVDITYTVIPYREPFYITDITIYNGERFCFLKEFNILLPEKVLLGIVERKK